MATDNQESRSGPVSLADEEAVKQILVDTVFGLWDIVNNLTRLKPSKRERYRVTIFGSARAKPGTFAYDEVKRVAAALAEMGCDIVTGGGPGLMQAANEGAASVNAAERKFSTSASGWTVSATKFSAETRTNMPAATEILPEGTASFVSIAQKLGMTQRRDRP